jgi:hypothetical protein
VRRTPAVVLLAIAIVVIVPMAAMAAWGSGGTGSSYAKARSMPAGNQPTATVSGRNVTVSWSASSFPDSTPVSGYIVARYNTSGVAQTIKTNCTGTITATSCVEQGVPAGTWRYGVSPKHGNWVGAEGTRSTDVTVGSPSVSLSPSSPNLTSLPGTLSGSIANFIGGETIRFRLDSTGGTELAGTVGGTATPTAAPTNGSASIQVTIPAGTANGSHTVHVVASTSGESASAAFSVTVAGGTPPTLSSLEMRDVNANGKVDRVVATFSENVTCTGGPCSTAPWDLDNVPSSGTLASVSVSTNTATLTLNEGSGAPNTAVGTFDITLTSGGIQDGDSMAATFTDEVPDDDAGPVPVDLTDTSGSTDGLMQSNDTLSVTFSEALDSSTVPSSTTVKEEDPSGSATIDVLSITGVTDGNRSLGAANYVANNKSASFASSGVALSGAGKVLTVTVGLTCSGDCTDLGAGSAANLDFQAATSIEDAAGNAAAGTLTKNIKLF